MSVRWLVDRFVGNAFVRHSTCRTLLAYLALFCTRRLIAFSISIFNRRLVFCLSVRPFNNNIVTPGYLVDLSKNYWFLYASVHLSVGWSFGWLITQRFKMHFYETLFCITSRHPLFNFILLLIHSFIPPSVHWYTQTFIHHSFELFVHNFLISQAHVLTTTWTCLWC